MPLAIEAGAHHLAAGNSGHEGRGVTHILITGGNRGLGRAMVDAAQSGRFFRHDGTEREF